jgi:dienelactone hydrolase
LLFDLLTHEEDEIDRYTRKYRFDIGLLAHRLEEVSRWVGTQLQLRELRLGYFGASTGSAAALIAASNLRHVVKAVVSRGGRPDLAEHVLPDVLAPTLLIVGELDEEVIEVNRHAFGLLTCEKELQIVPGASHLFEEPATLELAGALAADWFHDHLSAGAPPRQVPETAHAVR